MSAVVGGRRDSAAPSSTLTASASRRVTASIAHVWACLTTPSLIRGWFADADGFGPDGWFQYQFGDGDFFVARIVDQRPPTCLTLEWRFFGVGPLFTIRYELVSVQDGTEVTVTDRGALTEEERLSLTEGWTDFLQRLDTFATTGQPSRFLWSEAISAGIMLDRSAGIPVELTDSGWLRTTFPGARVDARVDTDAGVVLTFAERGWGATTTEARIRFTSLSNTGYLGVVHAGWPALDPHVRLAERRRYASLWQHGLAALEASCPPVR
jgi:uncharacterized protein YndB with AHSA1/START domain